MMIPIENLADSTIEFIAQKVKENPEIDLKPMMQYLRRGIGRIHQIQTQITSISFISS